MDYVEFLSLCHTVTIDNSSGKPEYNAASPDELAFVQFSEKCGYKFDGKDEQDRVTVINMETGKKR